MFPAGIYEVVTCGESVGGFTTERCRARQRQL